MLMRVMMMIKIRLPRRERGAELEQVGRVCDERKDDRHDDHNHVIMIIMIMIMIVMIMIMRAASWETSQEITRALTMTIILVISTISIIMMIMIIMIITMITRRSMKASNGERLDQAELTGDPLLLLARDSLIKW